MRKISIITVVRNAALELDATLNSIESVDYPSVEIIVIDGASTDSTSDVIKNHRNNISYTISEPDKGLYDAMNKGLEAATGDYVWFINAGDKIFEKETIRKTFAQTDNADIYYGEAMIYSIDGMELGLRKKKLPATLSWKSLTRGMVVCHQSFIVKRSIAPLYDLRYRYVADIDWVIKCLKNAETVHNTGLVLSKFVEGGISTQHRRTSLKERWKVMRKHYGLVKTTMAHIIFILESPFRKKYRKLNHASLPLKINTRASSINND